MKRLKSFLRTYRHALFVLLVPTLLISQASRAVPAYTDSAADPALNDFLLLHAAACAASKNKTSPAELPSWETDSNGEKSARYETHYW